MRPGRPSAHVKAKWVTWRDDGKAEREYYELEPVGKLVGGSANFAIHHSRPLRPTGTIAPTVSEAVYSASKFEDVVDGFTVDFSRNDEFDWIEDFQ
jgi:hypothetical protein